MKCTDRAGAGVQAREQARMAVGEVVQPLSRLCGETREQMLVGTVPVSLE